LQVTAFSAFGADSSDTAVGWERDGEMSDKITVGLVDDHAIIRQGVRAFMEIQGDLTIVGEAGSGEEAIRLCQDLAPDVLLMDLVMPGMDGVEATRQVKAVSPRTQVIILTSYHDDEHILPAMKAGALSYLLKDVDPVELVKAVRKAARGEVVLHPRVAAQVVHALHSSGAATRPGTANPLAELSEREMEVLRLIADGLSNTGIAERLCISEKTVKSHVSNILSKLQLADRTQAAVFAWRQGVMKAER
jgi:two-component system, NarL family, response regulator LiaR